MAKADRSVIYLCEECGEGSAQWLGRCPACGVFGSMRREVKEAPGGRAAAPRAEPLMMHEVGREPPRGEVGMVGAQLGLAMGAIGRQAYGVVVFMAVATTIVAPPLLNLAFRGVAAAPAVPETAEPV
jgi:hypothetical protein